MATVRELIKQLEQIEDKDLYVVIDTNTGVQSQIDVLGVGERYFGELEDNGWTACTRPCVILDGWEE